MKIDISGVRLGDLVVKKSDVKHILKLIRELREERERKVVYLNFEEACEEMYGGHLFDLQIRQAKDSIAEIDERIRALERILATGFRKLKKREK